MKAQNHKFASNLIKLISLGMLFGSVQAGAKNYEYSIKGMKCESCVESIKEKVCGQKGITKCDVEVGKMTLSTDDQAAPSPTQISDLVKSAGHYKVIEVKETK